MATKGVWQLKQVTIRYCQHSGSSRYVRQLLSDDRFHKFVEENPQVHFKTELKGARHPILVGEYVTNQRKVSDIKNQDINFIMKQLQRLRDSSGRKMTHIKKPVISKRISVQGIWQPTLNFPEFKISDRI
ncbi:Mitochondrial/chloroplast ribosomal protein 36a [Plasmopara halstedii]|uniref:Large ribosomal subunit protein mL43 n=1 Tax=Plasmopara halstedii TaxID=4781 RepID=A0A0P1AJE9_PLAHL|nr:Mitochondrial/chloroplast ribosomal protein 36a [Plasmopara halstedii]CEG40921.1 Mitochondrial/chloroplast ribosomal protein 36a [Plasmopara halstedii]|eukprot:XP_024577290.1 Mitochondrial/chloroplast ribosomal protein 36a [Plasmopara halstedii]